MGEVMVKGETAADDPRVAGVGFQRGGVRALAHNPRLTQPEHRSYQICLCADCARATRHHPPSI
jgi:hypothetical protein